MDLLIADMREGLVNFKVGDVVRLKSGGELMTIEGLSEDGWVECIWFNAKKVERDSFDPATLVKPD